MAKKKLLWIIVLAVITVFAVCLAACGDKATVYSIKWEVSENATVTVEDSEELPAEAKEGDTVSFTVEADEGYEVSAVRVNDRTVSADSSGKYNVIIRGETTIKVETEDTVESVAVTTNPSTMTYYAGETLDPEGMAVSVTYAGSGKTETVTNYTVVYQNGSAFALGDTSFSVKYLGVESAPVQLTKAVEVLITIDPVGGEIDASYLEGLKGNADLHNVAADEDGVITFSYSELTAEIALPTSDMWTRGEPGDYSFTGWTGGATKIAADNVESQTYEVQYRAGLLKLTHIEYRNEQVGEELVPYLVIEGTFNAATEAYLFLYEGNDKVELKGDTIGDADTERGDPFELKFDMRKLVAAGYLGKWMDIKFVARDGDREETQEIPLADYADIEDFVDTAQILVNGDYAYSFATYDGGNGNMLKAVYNNYFKNEYTMSVSLDENEDLVIEIAGEVDGTKYAGKTVRIDTWTNATHEGFGVIGADGKYNVKVTLTNTPLETDGYVHFSIIESQENPTVIYKDGEGNLLNAGCQNDNLETVSVGLIENQGALRVANEATSRVFYVGFGKWNGIVIRGTNEAVVTTEVTLELEDGKPYLVINGTYTEQFGKEATQAMLTEKLYADVQNNADTGSGSGSTNGWGNIMAFTFGTAEDGDTPAVPATMFFEITDEGTWAIKLDLSARTENAVGDWLFFHLSFDGATGTNFVSTVIDMDATIVAGDFQFRLGKFDGWGGNLVTVYVEAPEAAA